MYVFYFSHGITPVVVDADDYMTSEDFVRHLCSQIGLDPLQAKFKWSEPTEEERKAVHPSYYLSQKMLVDSTGVRPELAAKNRDLRAERTQWKGEFGPDLELVEEMVSLAMPHYEYLHEKRLRMPNHVARMAER